MSLVDPTEKINMSRLVNPAYGFSGLLKAEDAMSMTVGVLLDRMDVYAEQGEEMDLGRFLTFTALDIVGTFRTEILQYFADRLKDPLTLTSHRRGRLLPSLRLPASRVRHRRLPAAGTSLLRLRDDAAISPAPPQFPCRQSTRHMARYPTHELHHQDLPEGAV
jgi:hypothetical protein